MEAGSYCRTLKCLCWDLLQKTLFGLPSFPFPSNAGCHQSFVAVAPCPQPCGQCWVCASMAGRGTARETTSEQGQTPQPPWKPQPGIATKREPAQPHCSAALLPHPPLGAGWSRLQEQTCILMVLVPLWSLSSLVPPSMALTSIQPCAWLDTSTKCGEELKSTVPCLSPTQAPSPWFWLFQSDDSADTQGHCHHYHCAPEHP